EVLQIVSVLLVYFFDLLKRRFFPDLGVLVLLRTLEKLFIDNDTFHTAWCFQRSILGVAGLVAEDRTKQLFFRSGIRFTLWSDLTDQDISFLDMGADPD